MLNARRAVLSTYSLSTYKKRQSPDPRAGRRAPPCDTHAEPFTRSADRRVREAVRAVVLRNGRGESGGPGRERAQQEVARLVECAAPVVELIEVVSARAKQRGTIDADRVADERH